jgi:hypothetical protein
MRLCVTSCSVCCVHVRPEDGYLLVETRLKLPVTQRTLTVTVLPHEYSTIEQNFICYRRESTKISERMGGG